jgi:hypothetical protein
LGRGKKMKNILLTIFTFVFCLFVSGCGAKKLPEGALSAGQPAGTSLTGGSAKYSNDGKRIITIGAWYDKNYVSRHTDIHDDPKLSRFEAAQMKLDKMREIEKKYNIRGFPKTSVFGKATLDKVMHSLALPGQDLYDRGEWTWQRWREYLNGPAL